MKKFSYLLVTVVILMTFVSNSCKKEENPQDNPPSIALQKGHGYISADTTVKINDSIFFRIKTTPNGSTSAKITSLYFERNFSGQKSNATYSLTTNDVILSTKANSQVGKEIFTLTITDEKGATASVQVNVNTITPTFRPAPDAGGGRNEGLSLVPSIRFTR